MLNIRGLAILLAVLTAVLGYMAVPAHLGLKSHWTPFFHTVVIALIALHAIGLLMFAAALKRSDWHLLWIMPAAGLAVSRLLMRVFTLMGNVHPLEFAQIVIYPLLYLCVVLLTVYLVVANRRVGMAAFGSLWLGIAPLVLQYVNMLRFGH